jgi:hypothetical protein
MVKNSPEGDWYTFYSSYPYGSEIFFHESRRSMSLTAGIYLISRSLAPRLPERLYSESNEESGKKSRFRMDTSSFEVS